MTRVGEHHRRPGARGGHERLRRSNELRPPGLAVPQHDPVGGGHAEPRECRLDGVRIRHSCAEVGLGPRVVVDADDQCEHLTWVARASGPERCRGGDHGCQLAGEIVVGRDDGHVHRRRGRRGDIEHAERHRQGAPGPRIGCDEAQGSWQDRQDQRGDDAGRPSPCPHRSTPSEAVWSGGPSAVRTANLTWLFEARTRDPLINPAPQLVTRRSITVQRAPKTASSRRPSRRSACGRSTPCGTPEWRRRPPGDGRRPAGRGR